MKQMIREGVPNIFGNCTLCSFLFGIKADDFQ